MKLITQNFKTHAAKQFAESFSESSNTIYYIGAHKSTPFSDDNNPPDPTTNVSDTHYTLYDELIFGKHVTPADIAHMIRNEQWESGTIYDMYDNTVESLENKNF
jgi:hypothetical protein